MSGVRGARAVPLRSVAVGIATALAIAAFGFASGGYYPTAWGWGALAALWFVATYLVVATPTRPGALAVSFVGGLVFLGAWTWLSVAWSDDVDQSVLEGQRVVLYVAFAAGLVLLARIDTVEAVLGGALVGIFLPSGYGLITRLFPDRLGVFDPIAGYRLQEPLGYWNALGIFAAMGAALALGFAARGSLLSRALAGASLPLLLATTYFTFSRGAWISLAIGLGVAIAIDPRRLQTLAVALVLAPASALAVWLSSQQDALTRTDAPLSAATSEGHRLALYLVVLATASALVAVAFGAGERRVRVPRTARLAFAAALALIALAFLVGILVRHGGPVATVEKTWDAFSAPPPAPNPDLRERLLSFQGSYRAQVWEVAVDNYSAHPVLGSGAGSYEHYWNAHRPFWHIVRDAHTLYLETLAELGPLGLALLALALLAPLAAAVVARGHPLVPAGTAAYVAYLVHAGVDWDWEMPAVTIAALASGAALVGARARPDAVIVRPALRWAAVGAAVALAAVAFVNLVGASALAASEEALEKGRWEEAEEEAHKASRWWRWSPEPWTQMGEAQASAGDTRAAAQSFRKAVSKDRGDWALWYDVSAATEGPEARRALAEALRLNPFYANDVQEGTARASR